MYNVHLVEKMKHFVLLIESVFLRKKKHTVVYRMMVDWVGKGYINFNALTFMNYKIAGKSILKMCHPQSIGVCANHVPTINFLTNQMVKLLCLLVYFACVISFYLCFDEHICIAYINSYQLNISINPCACLSGWSFFVFNSICKSEWKKLRMKKDATM